MGNNIILMKNEEEANRFSARVMLATISFLLLVYILNVVGIFIAPKGPMTIACAIATVLLLLPSIIVFIFKCHGAWVKYAIVTASVLMVAVTNLLLSWHVVLMFVYPIAIASLYFSRKLSWFAVIISSLLLSASQIGSLYAGGISDKNLPRPFEMILYGIAPRGIELLAISVIFIMLSKRTKKLLQNVVGAEEQKATLDHIIALTDKSYEVSNVLASSVKALTEVTGNAIKSNEKITHETGNIFDGSEKTSRYVNEAGNIVANVSSELNLISRDNNEISRVSGEAMQLTKDNSANMKDAANEMQRIDRVTKDSKAIITKLAEKSNEISGIAKVITSISESTNLLSLNASIESARAGEQGKGFAVVAAQIRALAEQSQAAAGNIEKLIQTVLDDTLKAVNSMDMNATIVESGLALIHKADLSTEEVTKSIEKVNSMAQNTATLSSTVAADGEKINNAVEEINKLTAHNLEELKSIMNLSEDQLKAMNEVAASVESINTTSEELLQVVNQKIDQ